MTVEHSHIRERQRSTCLRVFRGISSAGRAVALQAIGQRFDPVILHQLIDIKYNTMYNVYIVESLMRSRGVWSSPLVS